MVSHVHRPEYLDRISIVNIDWLYDSIRGWTMRPAGDASVA